jgi:hypothetical protein
MLKEVKDGLNALQWLAGKDCGAIEVIGPNFQRH